MSWYPHARKRPLHFAATMPARRPCKAVELHTNGGGTDHGSLFVFFNRPGNDVAAHFQVMNDGTCEQYIDTDREAYAQFSGNAYCVSIETEDDGHPERPWTAAQLASIVALCKWVGCPPRLLKDGPSDGVGWHSQYRDNDQSGHACPGPVRIQQILHYIIPALEPPAPKPVATVLVAMPISVYNHAAEWTVSWPKRARWFVESVPPHDPSIVVLKMPVTVYNHRALWDENWGKRANWRLQ